MLYPNIDLYAYYSFKSWHTKCHQFNTSYIKGIYGEILDNRECHQFNTSYIKGTHGEILDNRECHRFNTSYIKGTHGEILDNRECHRNTMVSLETKSFFIFCQTKNKLSIPDCEKLTSIKIIIHSFWSVIRTTDA